jgi:hypothetical protein
MGKIGDWITNFHIQEDFEIKRLVVVKRGKSVYHYWRETSNINKKNIFYIRIVDENYILKEGKIVHSWDECIDAIDAEVLKVKRHKIIENILDGRG